MKKVEKLSQQINKEEFINYYSTHTRADTAENYLISILDVKALAKLFGFKKSKAQIGQSVSNFYKNNNLVTIHIPGETHFIKVLETEVQDYLSKGYILGYEQSEETKNNRLMHSKQTKLERYGDENYNNQALNKETKLERYGNANYNNQEQIKKTQFEKYGGYAFNDWEKVSATNLERYGVTHNWKSIDPKLNGRATMYEEYGGKDAYYKHVQEKGQETKLKLYGDKFYSNHEKAQKTCLEKYGVPYYVLVEDCKIKLQSNTVRKKRVETRAKNHTFTTSTPEIVVKEILEDYFGQDDVTQSYQCDRYADNVTGYQYQCDFYIESLDLFIELNYHPTHGLHPFDSSNEDDVYKLNLLESNQTPWNKTVIDVWTNRDVEKYNCAKENKLNYIMLYPDDDYTDILNIIDKYFEDKNK